MINDGDYHEIDDATYIDDYVHVRNDGCPPGWPGAPAQAPCPSPGDPTEVEVVTGGKVERLRIWDSSTLTMSGGTVTDRLAALHSSTLTMSGGTVGWTVFDGLLSAVNSSTVLMSGGTVTTAQSLHSSTLTMSGGTVEYELKAYDSSAITLSGGTVTNLVSSGSSTATMSGGTVKDRLGAFHSSTVTMTGGTVEVRLAVFQSSTLTMSGGTVDGRLYALHNATLIIDGSGFAVDGTRVPYGNLTANTGTLTGTLNSGDSLNNVFYQGCYDGGTWQTTGTIRLVPEPSHAVLLGSALLGLLGLARRGPAWSSRTRA
jgi:hypothetical protein